MIETIHPPLPNPEPAVAGIQALRKSLMRWRLIAVSALLALACVCAIHWPQATTSALLLLAHVVVAWGGYLYLVHEGDQDMGIARRDAGLESIHPQPPIA